MNLNACQKCLDFTCDDCRRINADKSVHLAKLWVLLGETKGAIDNSILPLAGHLSLDDPSLMEALEILSSSIERHFQRFRLVAEPQRGKR